MTDPQPSVAPTTTSEEDLFTAAARSLNRIWEYTQATIAITVVMSTLFYAVTKATPEVAVAMLSNAFGLVVGFYFSRTNHTRTGGVVSLKPPPTSVE